MSYFAFSTDQDGNVRVSQDDMNRWLNFMAEQSEMQTLLLKKLMNLEGITLEELQDVD